MSAGSLTAYVEGIATDPVRAAELRAALVDGAALTAYADARDHSVTLAEAEELLPAFRALLDAAGAQSLSDQALDQVSGAGVRLVTSNKDIEVE
ncbi:hypothetical protein GCM10007301_27110 [Azorhizobium oxalatiphilum]|uniref:Uncharacterized protein n=1 Tax=Azorhizobium oxalatiphilum TaxID=980631 RepID=A0A917C0F7_9HYPH|nr:hypothetical protein [Azorhizobium oxalatiphilum]GGF65993.1 hypothetical protein GCM10007301_27110 [Azorhizobium oxalatiphilum]